MSFPDPVADYSVIQLYRKEPGDLSIPDMPFFPPEGVSLDDVAMERLASYFADDRRIAREKPTQARTLDKNGVVIATYRMMPGGPERVRI